VLPTAAGPVLQLHRLLGAVVMQLQEHLVRCCSYNQGLFIVYLCYHLISLA
jgi:hypothetical protein